MKPSFLSAKRPPSNMLRRQLLLVLGGTWLVAFGLIILGIFAFTFRVEEDTWKTRQDEAARTTAVTVAKAVQRVRDLLFATGLLGVDEATLDQTSLQALLEYNPTLQEIVVIDELGQVIASAHQTTGVLASLNTIPQSRWYLAARAGQTFISSIQFSALDEPYLIIASPASDQHVTVARVNMNILGQVVTDIRLGTTGRAYIVDAAGRIIAHTNPEIVLTQTYITDHPEFQAATLAPNRRWSGSYTNFEGVTVVGTTAPVPESDWIVMMELSQDEAYRDSRTALLWLGGGVVVVGTILLSFIALRIQRVIFEPLEQLRAGVERFGEENLDYRLNFKQQNELGKLAYSFDVMANRLQTRDKQIHAQAQILRDEVDKRQHAEAEAVAQRDFAVQVMNSMGQGLGVLDAEFRFKYVNPNGAKLLGYEPEALIDRSPADLIFAEDQTALQDMMAHWRTGASTTYETRIRHASAGAVDVLATITPQIHNGQFVGIIGVITDLTERKLNELALRMSEERYRQLASKLQQLNNDLEDRVRERTLELQSALDKARQANQLKQEFLANTSHELRTPLSGIMGALNLVLEDTCETREEEREMIGIAYQASRNLLTIVTDILDTAKIEAGQWAVDIKPLPVLPMVNEVYRLSQPQAEAKGLSLKIQAEAEPVVLADIDGFRRILLNLMTNAIKFTENGSVTLAISQTDIYAHIEVIDTGIGISAEQQTRLFQPFVQADGSTTRKFGGSGLGLSISRLLATAMNGNITMRSHGIGQGTTFTIALPLAPPQPADALSLAEPETV